ncbi:MAG: hypothetical protein J7J43_03530 [Thermosipho sp. (in: Bacteria)]|nr:hypothetical protein [Thermosipho sp. (in: thermotogales)]
MPIDKVKGFEYSPKIGEKNEVMIKLAFKCKYLSKGSLKEKIVVRREIMNTIMIIFLI